MANKNLQINEGGGRQPSQYTVELFELMQKEINDIKIITAEQGKDITYIKDKLDTFIAKADGNYARKSVEEDVRCLEKKLAEQSNKSDDRKWQIMTMAVMVIIGIVLAALNLN